MISLIPATAGGRRGITMSQQISRTEQERIDELVWRTREKEERKKKKKELQVGEASSSSQECPSGQETTIATSEVEYTVLIRCTGPGDESARTKKQMTNWVRKKKYMLKNRKKQQSNKKVDPPMMMMTNPEMNHPW